MSFAPFGQIDLKPLFEILEFLKIDDIYKFEIAKVAYKQKNNLLHIAITNYFECPNTESTRRTSSRLSSRSQVAPPSNSTFASKSIQKKMTEVWNEIPNEIKTTPYFNSFKKMLKSHFILLYV